MKEAPPEVWDVNWGQVAQEERTVRADAYTCELAFWIEKISGYPHTTEIRETKIQLDVPLFSQIFVDIKNDLCRIVNLVGENGSCLFRKCF
ncbi:hypothetical protein Psta_3437 [Pirellula staleyi DSM 6068]|uniref:Uncharacterized protein n=1 Tax=Pirellula staleyi (strain ATCC 27377 / DSM 6068 / ICPB 4128) TaxID=530564 RepID=D2QY23_PIRSD|nr:hypothetical protein [Pirellula staleyi]ADB18100.1 hypothetical protein Psta_3437 [Pirellula staleyi DSM 6068]